MKTLILTIGIALYLQGCGHFTQTTDKALKDSIALADGAKVLGNLTFGITEEEFKTQKNIFSKTQNDSIYGLWIPEITGKFTKDNQLYSVTFLSEYTDQEKNYHPFDEFARMKFGKPTNGRNIWVVGDRRIRLTLDETLNFRALLRKSYRKVQANPTYALSPKTGLQSENYCIMVISSDSLSKVIHMQEQEQAAQAYRQYEEQQKQKKEQMKKELRNL